MPGRPPWSQPGTQGGGQTVAVNDRPKLVVKDFTQTTSLASGNKETVTIYAPSGSVWRVSQMHLRVNPDSNATSGNHYFSLKSAGSTANTVLFGKSAYNGQIKYDSGVWSSADSNQAPGDAAAQQAQMQSLMATDSQPLEVRYNNGTDAAQDNKRTVVFVFEEVSY